MVISAQTSLDKVIGTYCCETSDWDMDTLAAAINTIQDRAVHQDKEVHKMIFTGTVFEHKGTEYQLLIVSRSKLFAYDLVAIVRNTKKSM